MKSGEISGFLFLELLRLQRAEICLAVPAPISKTLSATLGRITSAIHLRLSRPTISGFS